MNTTPELDYHGKTLAFEPINVSLIAVADGLARGLTMLAQLEPGDGTHYCLLIVPAWSDHVRAHLGRYGIRESTSDEYLIVTKLDDHSGETCYAFKDGVETWDLGGIKNGWTRELLAWWLNRLWSQIKELQ